MSQMVVLEGACVGATCNAVGASTTSYAALAGGLAVAGAIIYGTVVDPVFFGKVSDKLPDLSTVQGLKTGVSAMVSGLTTRKSPPGEKGWEKLE